MEDRRRQSLLEYLAERTNRPFGDVDAVSGRTLQRFSFAGSQAAENLLGKARRALDDHNVDRARQLVDRAVRLPFDEHEGAAPAAFAMHMDLFCAVTDALEQSEANDSRWLDAALEVLEGADSAAACELRDVLVAIDDDYLLGPAERRRIRAGIASIPDRAELTDLECTAPELRENVMSILGARRHYDAVLEKLTG